MRKDKVDTTASCTNQVLEWSVGVMAGQPTAPPGASMELVTS